MKKLLFFLSLLFLWLFQPAAVLAAPPANFQSTLKIGSGLTAPTGFDIAPDGRIFILQRTGEIKIYKNGQLLPDNFAVLPTISTGDRGLIGIAFDPDFLNNHFVYFYYTDTDLKNKVVRFDASSDTGTNGPLVLYQTDDQSFQLHVGGTIRFGPDGKIYISIGDNGVSTNSQDLSNVHGKILRINKDGTFPIDNPFVGKAGAKPEIWAYGLRNPFRFQFDSATGNLYEGEVGQDTWEEINLIKSGNNYGWPGCEGICNPANALYTNPIYSYNHNGGSASIVGGPVYHGQMFPANYQGRLFFGDYALGFMRTMTLDSNGNSTGVTDFDTNAGSVVDMKVDPKDGSMYYLTIFPGKLFQTTYSTGVKVPVANASANVTTGPSTLAVQFSSNGSSDPNNLPLTYSWNFGDNTTSTSQNPVKNYTTNGKYIVQLTVSNGTYSALANPIVIQVGTPPTVSINAPSNASTYRAGDVISYSASAVDGNGTAMNNNSLSTTVAFHHQTHIHPFLGPLTGGTGQFTIPTTGEGSPETWYEIIVTATDTNGLTATKSIVINPLKATITFNTNPQGLQIVLDGQPETTPLTIQGVINFQRVISAPALQVLNGTTYSFKQWSDNGAFKHTVTVQPTNTSYTATFEQTPPFSGQYFSNMTVTGSPALTRQDAQIDFDWGTTPPPGLAHDHYSVRWTKQQYFSAGRYTFTTGSDDGNRLYIDNNLVINQWVDQALNFKSADVDLTEGTHTITMEYYQNGGGAIVSLDWDYALVQPTGTPTQTPTPTPTTALPTPTGVPAMPTPTATPTPTPVLPTATLTPTPVTGQRLGGMNLNGYCVSINAGNDASPSGSNWICSKTGQIIAMTTACQWQYNIQNTVARQDVAGNPYSWSCYSTLTPTITMPTPTIKPTATPAATPTPTIKPTATPTPTVVPLAGYLGKYWNLATNAIFPPTTIPTTTPALTRTDTLIDFTWNNTSPDTKINADNFIVQWTKTQAFTAGSYTFTLTSDDGSRVYIDNQLVINQWTDHSSNTVTANKTITNGNHTLRIEYYEHGGGAVAKFSFLKN